MKKTKLQRVVALLLAAAFLFCGGSMTVGAADAGSSGSTTDITAADIKELLNAISYEEYVDRYFYNADKNPEGVKRAEGGIIVIDAVSQFSEGQSTTKDWRVDTFGGVEALYTPGDGIITWVTEDVSAVGRYSIEIEYYPIANKSASIERVFYINGKVPFKEARYLTLSKVWKNVYPKWYLTLKDGESADSYLAEAATVGIKATYEADKNRVAYEMPAYWTEAISKFADENLARFFTIDIDGNEIRPGLEQAPEWRTYEFRDSDGFYTESFEFVITPDADGKVTLSLEGVNEPMAIKSIKLVPHEDMIDYDSYLASLGENKNAVGKDIIKIEGEEFFASSSQTIYAVSDRSCAINSPTDTSRNVLNVIGGEKWQIAGQWVSYAFEVGSNGMYDVGFRFRQNFLDGLYVSRSMGLVACYLDADGNVVPYTEEAYLAKFGNLAGYYDGVPFKEAAQLQFGYDTDWQSSFLTDDSTAKGKSYNLYFESGVVYIMEFEVTVGDMGEIVRTVQQSLDSINQDYLDILQLTGTNPDQYRDYGFLRVLPDTINDFAEQRNTLRTISETLAQMAGVKSSMTATLDRIWDLLDRMTDEDEVAPNLDQLKSYIGTLGTWLGDAKTQPLQIDYLMIQPAGGQTPKAMPNFWQSLCHEISSFFQSFIRNYDRMGATAEATEDATEVWLAYGRDQSQVIRNLINNDFTPNPEYFDKEGKEITVDLKLVAGGTLLPSILSGSGPDVYIGLGEDTVINYAIRGALIAIEDMEGFDEMCFGTEDHAAQFNEAAMIVMGIEDSAGVMHYYGLPETQGFNMMFVREDILANLEIDIPRTWDDVLAAIPTLQANNMAIGMHTDYKIFLYQSGGELFADGGMRINLDSNVALESFETMCNLFTMYGFPYNYSFANRFRTGEMPIGFAGYTGTYNHLKVFATEIEGLWSFYPLPGLEVTDEKGNTVLDENGNPVINNVAVSACSAIVMIVGCDNEYNAWQFMKWHVGAECQTDYSNEMVALIGPSAKHSTANLEALESMPWTTEEYKQLQLQFNSLASIPNYPGSYIIGRYTKFAFLSAYNDNADPIEELLSYITTINKEITRKRDEFDLEILEYIGQTLAEKRYNQAMQELKKLRSTAEWQSSYDDLYQKAASFLDKNFDKDVDGYAAGEYCKLRDTVDYAAIRALADEFEESNATLFADVVKYIRNAVTSLESYEAYK